MIKKIRKWFWVWQEDKEKAFLEEMALQGYLLISVGFGTYIFKKDSPQKMVYQFDFKGLSKMPEEEYLQIYEDAGWQCVSRFGSWYYFARAWEEEEPDVSLFNDQASKRAKFRRLLLFVLLSGIPLYYSNIFLFPTIEVTKFDFPGFYFYFRILTLILMILHLAALVKIYSMYRKLKNPIRE